MKSLLKSLIAVTIVCMIFTAKLAKADELPVSAKIVPSETIVLIEVKDVNDLMIRSQKTNFYKMLKDPAMKPFIDDVKKRWQEKMGEDESSEFLDAWKQGKIKLTGRVVFALILNEAAVKKDEPAGLIVAQMGENINKFKEFMEEEIDKSVDDGAHVKTSEYRDIQIRTLIAAEEDDRLGYGFASNVSYCYIDDVFALCEDIEVLKFAIAHIKGAAGGSLADTSDYSSAIKTINGSRDLTCYINIKGIMETAIKSDTSGELKDSLNKLGVDNVTSLAYAFDIAARPAEQYSAKAFLKTDGPKKGICKMLEPQSRPLKLPAFVPADAYTVGIFNIDFRNAFTELVNIVTSFSPQGAAAFYTPIIPQGPEGQKGLTIKADIIDHLGSKLITAQTINKEINAQLSPTESLLCLEAANARELEKSMSRLHSQFIAAQDPDAKRELLGHTIYILSVQSLFPFFGGGMMPMAAPGMQPKAQPPLSNMAFTFAESWMIFGSEKAVEQAIRKLNSKDTEQITSQKWFEIAKSSLPSNVGIAYIEDASKSAEMFFKLLKESGKEGSSVNLGPIWFSSDEEKYFDPALLCDFEAVKKYFGTVGIYGVSKPDGFFFEFKYLNPSVK